MADIRTAAAFVRANMPDGITWLDPVLSEQQAWDVAAYVDGKPRPVGTATHGLNPRRGESSITLEPAGSGALGWPRQRSPEPPASR